ncbi:dipeptidase 1 isoform X2 [Pseudorca crassidens]|uniref:dipeptidase 1 isoform X2 n=1 Tax=Pseudorca crassidens TaxID=82174 RepID=UPI00352C9E5E
MLCARREGPGAQVSPVSLLPTAPNSALPLMPAACRRRPPPPTARPEARGPARGSEGAETRWAVCAGHAWLTCLRKRGPADTCAAFGPLSRALRTAGEDTRTGAAGERIPGDRAMWASWWFWPLVAVCTADQFRNTAERIMQGTPVIDGHNDLPWQLLKLFNNQLQDPRANLTSLAHTHTNIPKLRAGFVGAQFWSAYTPCDTQNKDAVKRTLEQIDVIHRMCQLYPETFLCVTDSTGIRRAFREGKVASLVGVEGGHSIDSSLGVLRALYHLGMRYLTLTHSCNTPWADNWLVDTGEDEARSQGLSLFGQKETGSLVMVNFYSDYVSCRAEANLSQVADHLDHIKKVAGAGAVGLGGDYDGVSRLPSGLEDVSKYPDLAAELLRRQWTEAEVKGVLADNLLRVFEAVEQVSGPQSPRRRPPPALRQAADLHLSPGAQSHTGSRRGAHPLGPAGGLLQDQLRLLRGPQPPPPAGGPAGLPCAPRPLPVSPLTPWVLERQRLPVRSDWPVLGRHLRSPGRHKTQARRDPQ